MKKDRYNIYTQHCCNIMYYTVMSKLYNILYFCIWPREREKERESVDMRVIDIFFLQEIKYYLGIY